VENRSVLTQFNLQILQETLSMAPFPLDMLIEGNDPRGIDIGLLSRFPILSMRSHAHEGELPVHKRLFSRDCAVYQIQLPGGKDLWLLANHLKSKHGKDSEASAELRLKQAKRVKEIYEELRQEHDYVLVAGDLNDHPLSDPMKPLVRQTDLKDVMKHPNYRGKLPGTLYAFTTQEKKIDYILLSPALWALVAESGAEYSGAYAPKILRDQNIKPLEGLTKANAASDHAAVWVDLALP
jgi:endonuclease/exonuclease/phosphatase family metal-dependent hydrolase